MRTFGLIAIIVGGALYFWCTEAEKGVEPLPPGVEAIDAVRRYPMGRLELGRYAGVAVGATGLLLVFMPTGRA
jgi:hypothetical protein